MTTPNIPEEVARYVAATEPDTTITNTMISLRCTSREAAVRVMERFIGLTGAHTGLLRGATWLALGNVMVTWPSGDAL